MKGAKTRISQGDETRQEPKPIIVMHFGQLFRGFLIMILILSSSCKTSGQKQVSSNKISREDSIRKAEGLTDSIEVIANEAYYDKASDTWSHSIEFIDYNRNSEYHPVISPMDSSDSIEYYTMYKYIKLDSIAIAEHLHKIINGNELKGKWLQVFKYKGRFYLYSDCDFVMNFELNDSTFIHYYMDGPYPERLMEINGNQFSTVSRTNKSYSPALFRSQYTLKIFDPALKIYLLRDGDDCYYVVNEKNIHNLPIIVQLCNDEDDNLVEFDKTDCK